jgi:hypothetical protein
MFQGSVWIVIVTMAVLVWSAVLTALGQTAAVGALVPSLGFLVHQVSQAVQAADKGRGEGGRGARESAQPRETGPAGQAGPRGQEPQA